MATLTTFDEDMGRLLEFVRILGHECSELRWVCREDFYRARKDVLLASDMPLATNEQVAKSTYDRGVETGLGASLGAEFTHDGVAYGSAWCPSDELDAEYAMMPRGGGLKIWAADPLLEAVWVNRFSWRFRRRFSKRYRSHMANHLSAPTRGIVVV